MRGGTPHIIPRNVSSGKRLALLVHANWQWGNFFWLLVGENALTLPWTFLQSFALTVNSARDSHDSLARVTDNLIYGSHNYRIADRKTSRHARSIDCTTNEVGNTRHLHC